MENILSEINTFYGIMFISFGVIMLFVSWWALHLFYFTGRNDIEFLTDKKKKEYHDEFLRKLGINNEIEKNMNTKDYIIFWLRSFGNFLLFAMVAVLYIFIALFLAIGMVKYYLWIPLSIGLVGYITYRIRKRILNKKQLVKINVS